MQLTVIRSATNHDFSPLRPPSKGIPPPKAVCPDLLIGVKSMAYVMRYNHFPD